MKRGSIFETDGIPRMSEALPPCHAACRSYDRWLCHTGDHRFRSSSRRTLQRRPGYPDPVGTGHCSIVNFASAVSDWRKGEICNWLRPADYHGCQLCLRAKYAGDSGIVWNSSNHGCGDCWWYRSSCYGFAGQEDSGIFPAANHRNSRIYHRSFPVSDCHQLYGRRYQQSELRILAELGNCIFHA